MTKTITALFGLLALFAGAAFAQIDSFPGQLAMNVSSSGDETRPRIVGVTPAVSKPEFTADIVSTELTVFRMVNRKRVQYGLPALQWNGELEILAQRHSQDMAINKYFGHRGLDGSIVSDRADRCGIRRWSAIGENIAYNRGYDEPMEKALELWMDSPSHRQNMLNGQWRESAVGVAIAADGSYYFTQVFLKR